MTESDASIICLDSSVICLDTTNSSNNNSSSCIIIPDSSEDEKKVVPEVLKEEKKSKRPIAVVKSNSCVKRERDASVPDPNAENVKPTCSREGKLPCTPSESGCKRRRIDLGDQPLASTPLAESAIAPKQKTETPINVRYERVRADLSATKKEQKKQIDDFTKLEEKFNTLQEEFTSKKKREEEEEKKAAMVPLHVQTDKSDSVLRPVIIDASNVAMSHGNHRIFSCKGIALCIQHFQQRGHKNISAMVPLHRKTARYPPIKDAHILDDLESKGLLHLTPSRFLEGRRLTPYDDRMMLQLACRNGGVIVSNDNYRDLMGESVQFKHIITNRLIMYTFVGDTFMIPEDPHGRRGPKLDQILRWPEKAPLPSMVHSAVPNPYRRTPMEQLKYNLYGRFIKH